MKKQKGTFWFTLNKKGISLIVLVITILVMIIIAGATILLLSNSGVFDRAREARFKNSMKAYVESFNVYMTNKLAIDGTIDVTTIDVALVTNGENQELKNIIGNVEREHVKYLSIEDGILVFNIPENAEDLDVLYAGFACEIGVKVAGIDTCSDIKNINRKAYLKGDFNAETGVNDPDLTGFSVVNTRYVSYGANGEMIIGETIDNEPPANWYEYTDSTTQTNNRWANIVTINSVNIGYFVWIPRYEYKVESNITTVNFIPRATITASDGFNIPEAFSWNMEDDGEVKQLSGIWASKYKLSENNKTNTNLVYVVDGNVINATVETTASGSLKYEYYIAKSDETPVKKSLTTDNTYQFTNIQNDNIYDIYVQVYQTDGSGNITNLIGTSVKKIYVSEIKKPNVEGFNQAKTRYITYDSYGKELDGNNISSIAPANWYDYTANKWANIKTINNLNTAYFTWIPRYEYRTYYYNNNIRTDINYISSLKTTATDGFSIPEAFTWNMTDSGGTVINLDGFWTSKYKLSENNKKMIDFTYKTTANNIDITEIVHTATAGTGTMLYEFYISKVGSNIVKVGEKQTGVYTYLNLLPNTEYDVLIKAYSVDVSGNVIAYIGECEKYVYTYMPDAPSLIGFNPANTRYVTWSDETDINSEVEGNLISDSAPVNWYDYLNNRWANIKVTTGNNTAYLTWIPKFEYRTYYYNGTIATDINYIPSSKITPTPGYKIPESFEWNITEDGGQNIRLPGFWVSKFKLSQNT